MIKNIPEDPKDLLIFGLFMLCMALVMHIIGKELFKRD